jgi:hypothetical protein
LIVPVLLFSALLASPHLNGGKAPRLLTPLALGQVLVAADPSERAALALSGPRPAENEPLLAAPVLRASAAGRSECPDALRLLATIPPPKPPIADERHVPARLLPHRLGSASCADGLSPRPPPV